MIIYKAENKITGEVYIGQTKGTLRHRRSDHHYEAFTRQRSDKFHKALRKFGKQVFDWCEIYQGRNKILLAKAERDFIIKFNAIENGYNTQIRRDGVC